jgi:AcrR family transcriptional regulator
MCNDGSMENCPPRDEGLRARKRRETRQRIAKEGLKLFAENGYDATTLETVAARAQISPRTLFYYFKTKDDILHFWQGSGFLSALAPTMLEQRRDRGPLDAVRACLLQLIARYDTAESVIVDRVLNASETLRMRKQLIYLQMEETIFKALCELWPDPIQRSSLRAIAMMSIGAVRIAFEARRGDPKKRPLIEYLKESFASVETSLEGNTKRKLGHPRVRMKP